MTPDDLMMPQNRWMWCVLYGHGSPVDGKCPRCNEDCDPEYSVKLDQE